MVRSIPVVLATILLGLATTSGVASASECSTGEPDSLHLSWNTPCEDGSWLQDETGQCRMWDWHPNGEDDAIWTGSCRMGAKSAFGTLQWFEHGIPIDRFEGTYQNNKRNGFGRYQWNQRASFSGQYVEDLPHGYGIAIVEGLPLKGQWRAGCLESSGKRIAIGVPLATCPPPRDLVAER